MAATLTRGSSALSDDPPVYSLGRQVCQWIEWGLSVPSGPHYKKPIRLTHRQIKNAYDIYKFALIDGKFQRLTPRVVRVGAKGEGKSPEAAMFSAVEFLGPVVPYDVDDDGNLVGRADENALIQIFANSEKQGKRTTWRPLTSMLKNGRAGQKSGLYIGKTQIEVGSQLISYEAASADSAEGPETTFAVLEEIQYWVGTHMVELAETVVRNVGKKKGWVFGPTNQPSVGQGSWAESQINAAAEQKPGVLLIRPRATSEPIEDLFDKDNKPLVMAQLAEVFGDSADPEEGWVDLESVYRIMSSTSEYRARRYYLNESAKVEGRLVDPVMWERWKDPTAKIPEGADVVLGFDGSRSRDASGLVAMDMHTGVVELLGLWEKPIGVKREEYLIPKDEVRASIVAARERWRCRGLAVDPGIEWKTAAEQWALEWGEGHVSSIGDVTKKATYGFVFIVWMNGQALRTHEIVSTFESAMGADEQPVTHSGDERLTLHVTNMMRADSRKGRYLSVDKESEEASARIDGGVAFLLAFWASNKLRAVYDAGSVKTGHKTATSGAGEDWQSAFKGI